MSGTVPGSAQLDHPEGFILAAPYGTIDQALVVDIRAYLASVRANRNVLSARISMRSPSNTATDITMMLPRAVAGAAPSEYLHQALAGNQGLLLSSNRPVHVELRHANGTLDIEEQTLLVFTAPIVSLHLQNRRTDGDAQINLITV